MTEDRGQMPENRGQRTDDRGQRADDRISSVLSLCLLSSAFCPLKNCEGTIRIGGELIRGH